MAATLAETRRKAEEGILGLKREMAALDRQRRDDEAELRRLVGAPAGERQTARMADVQDRITAAERRLVEIEAELTSLEQARIEDADVTAALAQFDDLWGALSPREQARLLELLVERVTYDGQQGNVAITFRPTAIRELMSEIADEVEEFAA